MNLRNSFAALAVVVTLVSCGGGGGSPGVPLVGGTAGTGSPTGGGATTPVAAPSLKLTLKDSTGAETTSLGLTGTSAQAVLLDAAGAPVANKRVTFATDEDTAVVSPSSVLTDGNGAAVVQIAPASLAVTGAGTLTATGSVGATAITTAIDFGVTAANLKLLPISVGDPSLAAYGNRGLSVGVTIDGKPATTPVLVTFAASCGTPNPLSVSTNAVGIATTTYSATNTACFGSNVSLSASVTGATSVSGQIAVLTPAATNIQFVSTAPQTIYLSTSTGATQALVTFKVVDNTGAPIANSSVTLALANVGSGVSIDVVGNTSSVVKTTDSQGAVTVAVFAGSIPTSVQVTATAAGVAPTSSNVLTVASGRPVQKATSVSLGQFAIEGANIDGTTTTVSVSLADRQGNPVPDGTQVNLTSETGVLIPPSCVTSGGSSKCTVDIRSQGTRTSDGRVSILAYLPGEEDFQDLNSDNVYQLGEPFIDLGDAYRDDNEDGAFNPGEFTVPRVTGTCQNVLPGPPTSDNVVGGDHGRLDHCDGVWGTSDVRRQVVVVFATSTANITNFAEPANIATLSLAGAAVLVADLNGNSMPANSAIAVSSATSGCSVTTKITSVGNRYGPEVVPLVFANCAAGNDVTIEVTAPSGTKTIKSFTLAL